MNKQNICFSVIMPCYNSEEYVSNAVEGMLKQTYTNWELIAVNDGSTDNTLDILNRFANKDKRIKVFSKKNGGYATAVNFGLDKITGDYLLMLGSDDRFYSNLLLEIAEGIKENRPDIIAFRTVRYMAGEPIGLDSFTMFDTIAYLCNKSFYDFIINFPRHSSIMTNRDTSKCYKISLLGKLKYFGKYGICADDIFSTLFFYKCHSFMSIPIDGYFWEIRSNSVASTPNAEKYLDQITNWRKYLCELGKFDFSKITDHEKRCIVAPFRLARRILRDKNNVKCSNIIKIHRTLIKSIELSKQYNSSLLEFDEMFDQKALKKIFFLRFPVLYLFRHGFIR